MFNEINLSDVSFHCCETCFLFCWDVTLNFATITRTSVHTNLSFYQENSFKIFKGLKFENVYSNFCRTESFKRCQLCIFIHQGDNCLSENVNKCNIHLLKLFRALIQIL